ncbi:MAG: DNA polymerase III subunit alpha [Bacteroidetes bacterium]|nr:DNA polymerase III subunit alpha [Bacteroidota bacterium]
MSDFTHLHCHTQFSLLDGASGIPAMIKKAAADNMPAVALTDHGNMFGAFQFVNECNKAGIKPIVGCEFYIVEDRFQKSFTRGKKDKRYHQLILAKNQKGYENLTKLCSLGYIDGLYSKFPRIDRALLMQYKEGLIATSCCIGAEVPQAILFKGEEEAEKVLLEWLDIFGEDYYIELQRHNMKNIDNTGISQEDVNQVLLKWSRKYNVPVIATNDSHYVNEEDSNAHDILLCVNTGDIQSTPKGHGKGYRFGFPNEQFFFKTQEEMKQLFSDVPQAIENTGLIVDKVVPPQLKRDILLPAFKLPDGFETQGDYLRFITYEGARKKYGEVSADLEERINFELQVINNSGYPGYFLIVEDFTTVARQMGVSVGPGRGSAAGSVVAYCLGITNVDPIKYDLLFERFLNPERVSMPDIDIDFDDEGRQKVIDYVVDKYGKNQVAQIITYGSMAAKSSLRDVGRVLDVPLQEVDKVSKSFPDHLSATLNKVLADGGIDGKLKGQMNSDQVQQAMAFRDLAERDDTIGKMITTAKKLEGSVRNTGIHACGVIITPDDITNFVPVMTAKDSDLLVTQFDNSVVEDAGLLKMDFLGLKTLTIIKDAVSIVKERHGIEIDPDEIPLDDQKTYQLFQKGETNGVFQFESAGMQKNLKLLKPNKFGDLIAMNALYRPGPMDYIPSFIARKHGKEKITYDLPAMEGYLAETYGITVYQEQVMLLSQKLADFTKGQADMLRKAMGKKKKKLIDEMYPKFLEGCEKNGHPIEVVEKVWKDWEKFASYAFNKSHSTCYAYLAFQTAYLKAHYPAEFMAAVLSRNMNDIGKLNFFLDECNRMEVTTLGPDINESNLRFTVNKKGEVRFALSAIKGVGSNAVESIIEERKTQGAFSDVFDLTKRVNLRTVNKRSLENLAYAGAFDSFESIHRAQYFAPMPKEESTVLEKAIRFGGLYQKSKETAANSLFGDSLEEQTVDPVIPPADEWSKIIVLEKEKEVTGMYISGHPLDEYRMEIKWFANGDIVRLPEFKDRSVRIAALVAGVNKRVTKKGQPYAIIKLVDFKDSMDIFVHSKDYQKYNQIMELGNRILISGVYKSRYNQPDQYELKLNNVEFLSNLIDDRIKGIRMSVPYETVKPELIDDLEKLFRSNKGKKQLSFHLRSGTPGNGVPMYSRSVMVDVNKSLIKALNDIEFVKYKLIRNT